MRRRYAIFLALLLCCVSLRAQYRPGAQVLTFFSHVDDSDQPYALYLPKDVSLGKRYPLVVMLHGAFSNHRLALKRVFGQGNKPGETDVEATQYFPAFPDVEYIVAAPLARGTLGYQGIPEQDVMDVMEDVESRFRIDPDRVYLTGLSMGGGGTLWIGLTHPDIWAAIAPVCAAPPQSTTGLAANALNLNVHMFHGADDPVVPVQSTRDWVARFKQLGIKRVEYDEYPGVKHNAWDNAYAHGQIFRWFDQFKRDVYPKHVSYSTAGYSHRKAYWVVLDRLTPGTLASVDAEFTGTNQVKVETSQLAGFSLMLFHHPQFEAGKPMKVVIDGKSIDVPPIASTVSFAKTADGWKLGSAEPDEGEKQDGSEGPLEAALSGRHIYVFGTADHPAKDEIAKRMNEAIDDASWAPRGVKLELWLRSVADRDVRPSDWRSSNLILIGTKETNSIIADLSKELPMQLVSGAEGWNLTYIWPHEDHYVVISSGDPLANEAKSHAPGWLLVSPFPSILRELPDYALFHNGKKMAEGRFNDHWKITSAEAAKLKVSGVVAIREGAVE